MTLRIRATCHQQQWPQLAGPYRIAPCCLAAPAAALLLLFFVYPFIYAYCSFHPIEGGALPTIAQFLDTANLWANGANTCAWRCRRPINVGLRYRSPSRCEIRAAPIVVVDAVGDPSTLGTVLIAQGMLTYFGPQGLACRAARLHLYDGTVRLTHNYWGVLISLIISGFPFASAHAFVHHGIDPVLPRAAARSRRAGRSFSSRLSAAAGAGLGYGPSACRSCRPSRCFPRRCLLGSLPDRPE